MFGALANDGTENYPGVIRASYANFGFVPYGHTMVSEKIILI